MASTGRHDFDFLAGEWHVDHRRLKERLRGCTEWEVFDGTCSARPVLDGAGNVDDNVVNLPSGSYRAVTLRSFDAKHGRWAIWWLDARRPHALDVPVVGAFHDGVGLFFADDTLDGRPIRIRFRWLDMATGEPSWEQAFSADGGETWEVNWTMRFRKARG